MHDCKYEKRLDMLEDDVRDLSKLNLAMERQTVIIEMMLEQNAKRDEMYKEMQMQLIALNENVAILRNDFGRLNDSVDDFRTTEDDYKIDSRSILKSWVEKLIWIGLGVAGTNIILRFLEWG